MSSLGDRFKKFAGKTRYVVCRLFLHLYGQEIAPLIGILNRTGREAIDSEGDLEVMGEGLVEICQNLLQMNLYWFSVANEGDVFWHEGEAGDYVNELFTDSAARYLRELHKKDDPIVKWFDKGFPQTTLANGEVD